jgi:hydroxyethylthiazole kinase-like uncharacterized protein yjeF
MRLVSSEQMREIDRLTIAGGLVPGPELMERAGLGVFRVIRRRSRAPLAGRRVLIACGKGNNGGDGYVIARELIQAGAEVSIYVLAGDLNLAADAKNALHHLIPLHPTLRKFSDPGALAAFDADLAACELVVDALFGTGIAEALREPALDIVRAINASGRPVLSVDVPSGLSGNLDAEPRETVRAQLTATIGLPKLGLYYYPGRAAAGEVEVVDIGFPEAVLAEQAGHRRLVDRAVAAALVPAQDPAGHKYRRGALLIVAGSRRYGGAALLTVGGALRGGVGMVFAAVPASLVPLVQGRWPSAIAIGLAEDRDGRLAASALPLLREAAARVQAVALGPGLDRCEETSALLREWLGELTLPAVVDADALAAFAGDYAALAAQRGPRLLTPHAGELAALLGTSTAALEADREGQLRAARREGIVLLHKGAPSEIMGPDGLLYTVAGGHPAMARGGTGDVLTGLLGALLAQAPERPLDMARLGVWLHAEAGRLAGEHMDRGLCAGDLSEWLPEAWRELAGEARVLWQW